MNTSSEGSVLSRTVYWLTSTLGLLRPLSSYRIYNVEYAKLVSSRSFLEMGIQFLDEYGLGL